jgi:hypothetical protein
MVSQVVIVVLRAVTERKYSQPGNLLSFVRTTAS